MKFKEFCKKHSSAAAAIAVTAVFYLVFLSVYDMHYELNDDTMMRNILSGAYTGTPNPGCYFMLYPLGLMLSLIYRIVPFVQWYDVFLMLCQFVSLWLILVRLFDNCQGIKGKISVSVMWFMVSATYMLHYVVMPTFTAVSGILAVTAIFLFVTEKDRENLLIKSIPSVILIFVAFCIRYMIVPMMMPFICIGGIYQWSREKEIFSKENFKKYFGIFGIIIGCIAVAFAADKVAYSSQEWKDFREFCDDRAKVYDYAYVPLYENNKEFYEENSISFEQYCLLRSYDFSLDPDIDADIMAKLVNYSRKTGPDLKEKIRIAIGAYRIQITDKIGTPYHTLILTGYIMLFLSINKNNKLKIVFFSAALFFSRSVIWLYLLGQGRVVARVIHPLYWAEFMILLAIAASELDNIKNCKKFVLPVCVAALFIVSFKPAFSSFEEKYETAAAKAYYNEAVQKYCLENPDSLYLVPVYSIGVLTEKVFDGCEEPGNMELLGGWLVNSPMYCQKLKNYDIVQIDDALIGRDNVYIIQHSDYISYDTTEPFQWLTGYYKSKGCDVNVIKTDTVVENIEVYKIEKIN